MAQLTIKPQRSEENEWEWVGFVDGIDLSYFGNSPDEVAKNMLNDVSFVLNLLRETVAPNIDYSNQIVEKFAAVVDEALETAAFQAEMIKED